MLMAVCLRCASKVMVRDNRPSYFESWGGGDDQWLKMRGGGDLITLLSNSF